MAQKRVAEISRETAETRISLKIDLDGKGASSIATGIPFFDHMLTLFARHGLFDLEVTADGDVAVDYHHTVEDVGLVLGQALKQAVGEKKGITRYGFFILPMDECLARVATDFSNRPVLVYDVRAENYLIRDFNLLLVKEFFRALTNAAGLNLHVKLEYGEEPHHIGECLFKCLGRALDAATRLDPRIAGQLPSSKGVLA